MNFRSFGNAQPADGGLGRPEGLARQSSVYSLTFDEFQNTWGRGSGKDYGSMNMDELLKNLWNAEETQVMSLSTAAGKGSVPGGNLQRQGSFTLPRTLSQKTVEDVWKELMKESAGTQDGNGGGGSDMPESQPTLGDMTLEEFLVKAGAVKEDTQQPGRQNGHDFYGHLSGPDNNAGLAINFQQAGRCNGVFGHQIPENNNPMESQAQKQPLLPRPGNLAFSSPMQLTNNSQLVSPRGRGTLESGDQTRNLVQGGGLQGGPFAIGGLGTGGLSVAPVSPASQISSDITPKSGLDTSPVPYAFSRGRKSNVALEKVVERRQRRMIKNRESAARSRARKQAYTLELEAEIAKLKEINKELEQKQTEMMESQKNQILDTKCRQWGGKRQCLRRTLTGPW